MIEFKPWDRSQTASEYLHGSTIAYVPLGGGAYGLIVLTPWGKIHIEEVPPYGGGPCYYGEWYGSVEEAVEFIKKEWT